MTATEKECTKTRYKSERFALIDVQRIQKKKDGKRKPQRAYFCYCGYWHLTSMQNAEVVLKDRVIAALKKEVYDLKVEVMVLKIELAESKKISGNEKAKIKLDSRIVEMKAMTTKNQQTIKALRDEVFQLKKEKYKDFDNSVIKPS